ncbi:MULTISPECIES: sterol desaturase family protein [Actinomycetes]|nr:MULTISPECIES: sterol desaturase family protein [Actinomycetes]MCF6388769.1 sterol desaturase family protein [Mycobacterium sp. MBM]MCP9276358.1 sterol desaturase family protein [Mycolicibacterium sp. CAU 1645]TLH62613.1 sterol desaturase family protein [Mycolicibacterium neoaurum]TRW79487.1 sterol desaturase family protein [Mycolicibacterium sp. 018/SC-01/001]WAY17030.1 sterol desaturase family protein [Mycolicibacterium fortuitum]
MSTTSMTSMATSAVQVVARYGYVPFMLIGLNGAGIAVAAAGAPKYWLMVILVVAIATAFLVERVIPYDPEWNHDRADSTRDRIHVAVNETLILGSVAAIPLLAAIVPAPQLWPYSWPFVAQVLAAILVADFGITVVHLASHKIGVLWRFHAVHHSITRFYGLNGLMKHPLHQTAEMAAGVAPLILIGLPVNVASVLALAVAIQLLLQHSNADYRIGPAKYVLALNEGHRFHHLKWAGIGDVNFGLFTLVWDHLLRTYSYDPARRFDSTQLGMAAKPDYPSGYLRQMIYPFTRDGGCTLTPTATAATNGTETSTPDPSEKYRC